MSTSGIAYGALCIFVPVVWGLFIYGTTNAIEKGVMPLMRKSKGASSDAGSGDSLPIDYTI